MNITAVIFDCDGVLVDSEMLSAEVLTGLLSERGIEISAEVFRSDFLGRSFSAALELLYKRTGRILPPDFHEQYLQRLLPAFDLRLKPMPGIEAVLKQMRVATCVASGSKPPRLSKSLSCTGLAPWFGQHVFSGASVPHAKPAPDLFLHAASQLKVQPNRCLVIEDSEIGLLAAHAAGMTAWNFRGGSHFIDSPAARANAPYEAIVKNMAQLLDMFISHGLCSPA